MSALRFFSLEDVDEVDERVEGFVRRARRRGSGDAAARRTRVHCVRWRPLDRVVVMKEVHLWEEDTVSCDVHTIAARITHLQSAAQGTPAAPYLVPHLALHIDTSHHYQWLLDRCGPSLHDRLDADSRPPLVTEAQCRRWLRGVLVALDHLHRVCAYVHGDVSLGNILTRAVEPTGNDDAVLGDLESIAPIGAEPGGQAGTPLYTAPERLKDGGLPLGAHDDVWAIGIVAYQLLTRQTQGHPWLDQGTVASAAAPAAAAARDNYWQFLSAMAAVSDTPPLPYLQHSALATCCPAALPLVASCLSWNPSERPSAAVLLQDAWVAA